MNLIELPLWGYVVYGLVMTHLTIICVTVYLHRCQAHRALHLHPAVTHLMRLWLWLTTGMVTREWVAVHRKHHARVETAGDPHSPRIYGLGKVLFDGVDLYRQSAAEQTTLDTYGHGCPDDWLERHLYQPRSSWGFRLMLIINLLLFGAPGLTLWAVQMIWIPFFAAGVINGVGHYAGYRSFETEDTSTNIVPWGILIGGEELHNNHHAFASSARFSNRWYELDLGWIYIRMLELMGLGKVKKVAPRMALLNDKGHADAETVQAVITNRFQLMAQYAHKVLRPVHGAELRRMRGARRRLFKRARALLVREEAMLNGAARQHLEEALRQSETLALVYQYQQRLKALWRERSATQEALIAALQEWCQEAENSGVQALQEFARSLPRLTTAPA